MRFPVNISNRMQRYANKKNIITLIVVFITIVLVMEKSPIGSSTLKKLSGEKGMLDMQFGYSQLQVYNMLYSVEGYKVFYERVFSISSNWINRFDDAVIKQLYKAAGKKVVIMFQEVMHGKNESLRPYFGFRYVWNL